MLVWASESLLFIFLPEIIQINLVYCNGEKIKKTSDGVFFSPLQ